MRSLIMVLVVMFLVVGSVESNDDLYFVDQTDTSEGSIKIIDENGKNLKVQFAGIFKYIKKNTDYHRSGYCSSRTWTDEDKVDLLERFEWVVKICSGSVDIKVKVIQDETVIVKYLDITEKTGFWNWIKYYFKKRATRVKLISLVDWDGDGYDPRDAGHLMVNFDTAFVFLNITR